MKEEERKEVWTRRQTGIIWRGKEMRRVQEIPFPSHHEPSLDEKRDQMVHGWWRVWGWRTPSWQEFLAFLLVFCKNSCNSCWLPSSYRSFLPFPFIIKTRTDKRREWWSFDNEGKVGKGAWKGGLSVEILSLISYQISWHMKDNK